MGRRLRQLISQSEVNTFRTCQHKWGKRYLEGLRPINEGKALRRGSAVHEGAATAYTLAAMHQMTGTEDNLEALHGAGVKGVLGYFAEFFGTAIDHDAIVAVLDDDQAEQLHVALDIIPRFIDAFVVRDIERYEIVSVEHRFEVPIRDSRGTRGPAFDGIGAIDVILRQPHNNEYIVSEHKSTAMDCSTMDARLDVDPQTPGYVYALRELIEKTPLLPGRGESPQFGRVFLNAIRAKGMTAPKVNKIKKADVPDGFDLTRLKALQEDEAADGTNRGIVSAGAVDCDKATYDAAIIDQTRRLGMAPTAKQAERREQLPERADRWACRHEWFYTEQDVERWREEQLNTARLIRSARSGRLPLTRNGSACAPQNALSCAYRMVCVQDAPEIREGNYTVDHARGGRS